MSPHEALTNARNLLDRDGWAKHSLENGLGERCILGALYVGAGGRIARGNAPAGARFMDEAWPQALGAAQAAAGAVSLARWNNAPERTYSDIVAVLQAIADTAPEPELVLGEPPASEPVAVEQPALL